MKLARQAVVFVVQLAVADDSTSVAAYVSIAFEAVEHICVQRLLYDQASSRCHGHVFVDKLCKSDRDSTGLNQFMCMLCRASSSYPCQQAGPQAAPNCHSWLHLQASPLLQHSFSSLSTFKAQVEAVIQLQQNYLHLLAGVTKHEPAEC